MTDRLFVAVWPAADIVDTLTALPRPEIPGVRWTTAEQWHVTIRFFGEADVGEVDTALQRARLPRGPITARLGPDTKRFEHTLTVPVDGLESIAAAAVDATAAIGRRPERRAFTGHVTLARVRKRWPAAAAELRYELDMRWRVAEVTLVRSQLLPAGAAYETVARYPLS